MASFPPRTVRPGQSSPALPPRTTMAQTALLAVPNRDLLSSFSFNFYGTRLAASSLDHHVYVLSSDGATGQWPEDEDEDEDEDEEMREGANGVGSGPKANGKSGGGEREKGKGTVQSFAAHDGPVVKVVWAEPVHGEVLASAGTDGTVRIWEEVPTPAPQHYAASTSAGAAATIWTLRSRLPVSRNSVRDLAFAPSEHGLKLAAVAADSHLRLYDCLDVGTLATWNLVVDIDLVSLPAGPYARRDQVADGGGRADTLASSGPPSSATTSTTRQLTSIKGFEIGSRGTSGSTNADPATLSSTTAGSTSASTGLLESDGGWALSWCPEHWWGEMLVVAAGASGAIRLLRFGGGGGRGAGDEGGAGQGGPGDWEVVDVLAPEHDAPVASLAWGPACGREHQLVAAGHRDGRARLWRLEPPALDPSRSRSEPWTCALEAELSPSHARTEGQKATGGTGKVEWNVTGTVLATSGSDGKVRVWKLNYSGRWVDVAVVSCEEGTEDDVVEEASPAAKSRLSS